MKASKITIDRPGESCRRSYAGYNSKVAHATQAGVKKTAHIPIRKVANKRQKLQSTVLERAVGGVTHATDQR